MFFFFNDTATTEIYSLSLHDALPISLGHAEAQRGQAQHAVVHDGMHAEVLDGQGLGALDAVALEEDRKSTRLNSSHTVISYAVFCLKKKKKQMYDTYADRHSVQHERD